MWKFPPVQTSSKLHLPPTHGKLVRPSFQTASCVSFLPPFLLEIEFSDYLGDTKENLITESRVLSYKQIPPSPTFLPPGPYKREPKKNNGSLNTENIPNWQTPPQQSPLSLMLHLQSVTYHGTSALLEPKQRFSQSGPLCAFFNPSCEYLSFNWASIQ